MKQTVDIVRSPSTSHGTFGQATATNSSGETMQFITLELPWKLNARGKSCIPTGVYECDYGLSPSKGWVYKVFNVPDRSNILIHVGNFAGDTLKGYHTDSQGCILVGKTKSSGKPKKKDITQEMITHSRVTLSDLCSFMQHKSFTLEITNGTDKESKDRESSS
jgi:hypothetical protein